MKRFFAFFQAVCIGALVSSLAFGADTTVRKWGTNDILWGTYPGTYTYPSGKVVTYFPRYFDNNAFSDNLTLYGKGITGDDTGRVQGFSFGSASYTDNGYFNDIITKSPQVDVRAFMDGLSGRPTLAQWQADNTVDVTAALQAAANAVLEGGTLLVPFGTYSYSSLIISTSITIAGVGWRNQSKENFGNAGYFTTTTGSVLRCSKTSSGASITAITTGKGPRFRDIAIIGPGTGTSTAIVFGSATGSGYQILGRWSDVLIANFYKGLVLENVQDYTFDTLRIRGISTEALSFEGGGTNQNVFINAEIQKSGTGINVEWGSTNQFFGGLIQGNTTGLKLIPSGDGRVGSFAFKDIWWETNTKNITVDMTDGSIQHLILEGNNFQPDSDNTMWTMTNPNNRSISWLGLTNNTADSFTLNLTAVGGGGPTYAYVSGFGNRFGSITNGNATMNLFHNNEYIVNGNTTVSNLIARPAVYDNTGTLQTSTHIVTGYGTLGVDNTLTVTLSGASAFTGDGTYFVISNYKSGNGYVSNIDITSGASFKITGTVAGIVMWTATGY